MCRPAMQLSRSRLYHHKANIIQQARHVSMVGQQQGSSTSQAVLDPAPFYEQLKEQNGGERKPYSYTDSHRSRS